MKIGAMNHPAPDPLTGQPTDFVDGTNTANAKAAETAHIIQSRFVLAF